MHISHFLLPVHNPKETHQTAANQTTHLQSDYTAL